MSKITFSYLIKVALFAGAYTLAWIALFNYQIGVPTASSVSNYEVARKKLSLLPPAGTRKILLVGGSSSYYGLRAELIEKNTGIRTINMALAAGRGIQYILDQAKSFAKPDDIVIMALEYPLYQYNGIPSFVAADYIISRDPHYFHNLSIRDKFRYSSAMKPPEIIKRALKKIIYGPFPDEAQLTTSNDYGDETLNEHPWSQGEASRKRLLNKIHPYRYNKPLADTLGAEMIKKFSVWCKHHNVKLFATFPPFMHFRNYDNPAQKRFYNSLVPFYNRLGVHVVGDPYKFMYEKKDFFNTEFHLNAVTAEKNTLRLLDFIKSGFPNFASHYPLNR